ncbi:MAG: hypothetical protein ACLQUY_01365 [Ktedonobacterales bacterium]
MSWFGWFRRKKPVSMAQPGLMQLDGSPTMMIAGRERVLGVPYALPADMEEINRLDFSALHASASL